MHKVISVELISDYRIALQFEDGLQKIVNIKPFIGKGIGDKLRIWLTCQGQNSMIFKPFQHKFFGYDVGKAIGFGYLSSCLPAITVGIAINSRFILK